MIDTAIIRPARGGDPNAVLLGLTLADRLEKTLRRCGIHNIHFLTDGADVAGVPGPMLVCQADHVYSAALVALARAAPLERDAQRYGGLLATPDLAALDRPAVERAIDGAFWFHVDGREAHRRAEDALLESLIKPTDGPVARRLQRRLSLPLTRYLCRTALKPNHMTIVAMSLGLVGVCFLFQATWQSLAVGAVFIFLQTVFDHNDGELARLKFLGSEFGAYLDHISDDVLSTAYALGFGWTAAELMDQPIYWTMGIISAVLINVFHAVHYSQLVFVNKSGDPFKFRWWFQKDDQYLKNEFAAGGPLARLAEALHACGRRDVYVTAFTVFALARIPQAAVMWYAIVAAVHAVLALAHVMAGGLRQKEQMPRSS